MLLGCQDLVPRDTSSLFIPRFRRSEIFGFVADLERPCRRARFGRDAQASVECRHEPKNGGDHGRFSGPLGVLRFVDCFATSDHVEHGCSIDRSPEHRRSRREADSAAVRPSYADKQNHSLDSDLCAYSRACRLIRPERTREDRSAMMPWVKGVLFTSCYDVPAVLLRSV